MRLHIPADGARSFDKFLGRYGWILLAFAASRLLIFGTMLLSRTIVVGGEYAQNGGLLSVLTRWDGAWYLKIVNAGYSYTPGEHSSVGFFPFYPLLVKAVSLFGIDAAISAVLVSNISFLAAAILLHELIRVDYPDERVSRFAITFLVLSPVSFFFSSAYTESTFLALAVGAFLAARTDRWLIACLCGMCLAATRNVGVTILVPMVVEYLRQRSDQKAGMRSLLDARILLLGLIPLGLGAFLLFCELKFDDPFAYVRATAAWRRTFVTPVHTFINATGLPEFYQWLFYIIVCAGVIICAAGMKLRIRASYLVFSAILIAIYLCGNSLEGIPRYLSVVFPLFIILGLLATKHEWTFEPLLASSVMLLALCTILFANGYWMT